MCGRRRRRRSTTCIDSSISSCSGTPPTNTSAHESSAGPRRRVFEDVEAHVLCGPPPRGEKLTNTHSIQGGRNHSHIQSDCTFYWQTSCTGGAAEEAPTPPPPPPRHTLGTGHGQYWIYLVHEGRRTHSHSDRK